MFDGHNCRIRTSPFFISELVSSDVNAGDAVGAPDLKDEVLAFL